MIFIVVDERECIGCEECVIVCPRDVYVMECGKAYAKNAERCNGCCSCVEICPANAIYVDVCMD